MKAKKIYLVSSITSADINFTFLDSLLNHCEDLKKRGFAPQLILAPTKSYFKNSGFIEEIDNLLLKSDKALNSKIKIHLIQQADFATDPTASIVSLDHSVIVPGTTHRFKTLPRQTKSHYQPKLIAATGSINNKPSFVQTKAGLRSGEYFVTGALIVEIASDKKFHIRQLVFDGKGYQDLDRYYSPKKVEVRKTSALVMGDLHPGETCQETLKATYDMFDRFKPANVVLHDWFNGNSISHHLSDKPVYRAQQSLSLKQEVEIAAKLIGEIRDRSKAKVSLVSSNHPEHLERYLQEGRFIFDSLNLVFAADLFAKFVRKVNIFSSAFAEYIGLKSINFMTREDDLVIAGFSLASHGDHGPNGARSAKGCLTAEYICGHTHSPEILPSGGTYVGTSTHLDLNYTNASGFTSWLNTHALVYSNGTRSLIHVIDGEYTIQ